MQSTNEYKRIILCGMLTVVLILTGLFSIAPDIAYAAPTEPAIEDPAPDDPALDGPTPAAIQISTATIGKIKDRTYSGKRIKPSPKVKIAGVTLKTGQDYTVQYKNNKNPGKATLILKGKGDYTGSTQTSFKILLKAPKRIKASASVDQIIFKWSAVETASGYELRYASDEKFKKKKKTVQIKSRKTLKYAIEKPFDKQKFYAKVRSYKVIKGKKYYSAYTPVILFKTKNEKWIETDLSKQETYLHIGKKKIKTYTISSGKAVTPTVKGTYKIYLKRDDHDMKGYDIVKKRNYVQPHVRWILYFYRGYAYHAADWHNNFGHPMSHGCVNMRMAEAKYLYKWAPVGTRTVVHA